MDEFIFKIEKVINGFIFTNPNNDRFVSQESENFTNEIMQVIKNITDGNSCCIIKVGTEDINKQKGKF